MPISRQQHTFRNREVENSLSRFDSYHCTSHLAVGRHSVARVSVTRFQHYWPGCATHHKVPCLEEWCVAQTDHTSRSLMLVGSGRLFDARLNFPHRPLTIVVFKWTCHIQKSMCHCIAEHKQVMVMCSSPSSTCSGWLRGTGSIPYLLCSNAS